MANYVVSYDLNGKIPTHEQMDKHIAASGWDRGRILETVWYIGTSATIEEVYAYFNAILSPNDRIIVVRGAQAHFRNLLINNSSLQEAWKRNS